MHAPELEPPHGGPGTSAKITSAAAIIVALCSLALSAYEASATREHDRLSVWPHLSQFNSYEAGRWTRNVSNVGIGPAIVRWFVVTVDGRPVKRWGEAITAVDPAAANSSSITSSFGRGTVVLPNARVTMIQLDSGAISTAVARQQGRIHTRVCYCSLYNECWIDDSESSEPVSVRACGAAPGPELDL